MRLLTLRRSFLFRILVFNLLLISLIIFTLSTLLYFNFSSIGLKIVTSSILDRLTQTSYSTDYLKDASLAAISQVYIDPDIANELVTKGLGNIVQAEINLTLQRIVNSSDFIDSISVYSGVNDEFISTRDYLPQNEKDYLFNYIAEINRNNEVGSSLHPMPRKIVGGFNSKETIPVYTYIMFSDFLSQNRPERAVILNVKEEWLSNVIKSAGSKYLGDVFILDQNGMVMSHASQDMFHKDLSGEDYVKRVLQSGENGYFVTNIHNVNSLVTYVTSNQTGWKFISVLPFSAVVADMERSRYITLLVGLIIFFFGIILSYFIARGVSFPISKLKQKVLELKFPADNSTDDIEFITTGIIEASSKLRTFESLKREKAGLEKEAYIRDLSCRQWW